MTGAAAVAADVASRGGARARHLQRRQHLRRLGVLQWQHGRVAWRQAATAAGHARAGAAAADALPRAASRFDRRDALSAVLGQAAVAVALATVRRVVAQDNSALAVAVVAAACKEAREEQRQVRLVERRIECVAPGQLHSHALLELHKGHG